MILTGTNELGPDLGPATNNFPGTDTVEDRVFYADYTNVYYQLELQAVPVAPKVMSVPLGGSNVAYKTRGTNMPQGVQWSITTNGTAVQTNSDWTIPEGAERVAFVDGATHTNTMTNVSTVTIIGTNISAAVDDVKIHAHVTGNASLSDDEWFTVFSLAVTNIRFNWNTGASTNDAINIRLDYTTAYDISKGEWVKGGTNIPVCYTTGKVVAIKAKFVVQPASFTSVVIWAEAVGSGGSLGDMIKTNVTFSGGATTSEYVLFHIAGTMPGCIQKTANDVWQWKMEGVNGIGSASCDLNTSGVHTIYTILNEPAAPWANTAGNISNAWTKALDFVVLPGIACDFLLARIYSGHE